MSHKISGGIEEELGQRLKNIVLSRSEGKVIEIGDDDVRSSNEECDRSLLGKVVGERRASLYGLKRTLGRIWQITDPLEVRELSNKFFQFIFGNKEDKLKVLAGTNWIYDNRYLILHEWKEGLSAENPVFNFLNLWVQIYKIPLHWLSPEVGIKIGQIFQEVKNVMVIKGGRLRGNYLRLLVTVNLEEQLPRGTNIKLHNQLIGVTFLYEKLVNLCYYCGKVGHLDRSCAKRMADIKNASLNKGQFGEWMKALDNFNPNWSNSFPSQSNPSSEGTPRNNITTPNSAGSRKESAETEGAEMRV